MGHPFAQCTTAELKASCAQRYHAGHVRISPALNFCMQAGHGAAFIEDHCDCGAERILKCGFMQRSQKMCPQASSVACRRGKHGQIEHMRCLAMPPSTHFSSKPWSKLSELTSMQAMRFGKRGGG